MKALWYLAEELKSEELKSWIKEWNAKMDLQAEAIQPESFREYLWQTMAFPEEKKCG